MKYPLTEKAKIGARQLLKSWNEGKIDQLSAWTPSPGDKGIDIVGLSRSRILEKAGFPLAGVLLELSKYGIIDVRCVYGDDGRGKRIEILMLQELRNAVESDFEVSEFFLTMNAVGTIVQGDLTIFPGGIMQSAATNIGDIQQNIEQLADDLVQQLGAQFLQSNAELTQAIEDLRTATEADKPSRFGGLILQLGRCLQHGANTVGVVTGISMVAQYLSRFPI